MREGVGPLLLGLLTRTFIFWAPRAASSEAVRFGWEESIHLRCGYNQLGICTHVGMGSDSGIQLPECLGAAERAKAGNNSGWVLKGKKKKKTD